MYSPLLDYRARLLERMELVVTDLADALAAIPEARWHEYRGGLRTIHATVAHLRNMERDEYEVYKKLLTEDTPTFETFYASEPPSSLATEMLYYPNETMTKILGDYAGLREAELQLLRPLAAKDWARTGRHALLGLHTVQWWAERSLENAENRLNELKAIRMQTTA